MDDFYVVKKQKDSLINYSHRVEKKDREHFEEEREEKICGTYKESLKHKVMCYL